jgi:CheY-like chemotaxis protein
VRHASDLAQALAQLAAHRPDAVVLDVNIAGEAVYPLAERLAAEGTPFIFATGYGRHGIPPQWASRPVIQKPFDLHTLAVALATALSAAAPLR